MVVLVEGMFGFLVSVLIASQSIYQLIYIMVGGVCSIINLRFLFPNYQEQTRARHEASKGMTILAIKLF